MSLDARSTAILQAIVEIYIDGAQPVSSGAIVRRLRAHKVSSATVRAVMVELERDGYLHKPHTSAGRVPTDSGFRAYVDHLTDPRLLSRDRSRLEAAAADAKLDSFPMMLGQSLAGLSGLAAVVAVPRFLGTRVREVGLARCDDRRFIAFFVSPNGLVQQKLVNVDFELSNEQLQEAQNYLNQKLSKASIPELRELIRSELEDQRLTYDSLHRRVLEIGANALPEDQVSHDLKLIVEGASHLIGLPEFADVTKVRDLLEALEEREALLKLLDQILDSSGVKVFLGSEHEVDEVPDLACVGGASVGPAGENAAVGVLGPSRMNYERLVPLVDYATRLINRYWERL